MALGGGTFTSQNKGLPGVYLNFISATQASTSLSERGIATIPLEMDWGAEGKLFTVEQADLVKDSLKIFGYAYVAEQMKPVREIFAHAKTVHFFRLNQGGKKASGAMGTAKYPGTRGNDLRVVVEANEDSTGDSPLWDVSIYLGTTRVERQEAVAEASDLKANDYVEWSERAAFEPRIDGTLSGGENGSVVDAAYQTYLDQAEAYTFHAMGCASTSETVKGLFSSFCKRMRDDVGKKFQCVLFRKLADFEGVVSVKNGLADNKDSAALIPWVTGVMAGTAVNKSATNMTYDGEYTIDTDYTQTQLEAGLKEGSFLFHLVDGQGTVLEDINTFVTTTEEKNSDFSSNQTIRVLDQIANDIGVLFASRYLGKVQNDASGRVSLWNDIVKHHTQLQNIRAIEDFSAEDVTVEPGDNKKSVVVTDCVTPVSAMTQLYMSVYVS
jgi:hypothetical protein